MKQSYCILSFIFYLITLPTCLVYAQNEVPDNKGKEFWLMFNRNNDNKEINMELFITGDVECTGQVILPDASYLDFLVTPGAVTTVNIPSTFIATLADGIDNKGIHVIAENEITVYGLNHKPFSTDAFLGLPVDVLGKEYLVMSNSTYSPNSSTSSVFGVVATMDNTEVTIVPSSNTKNRTADVPYQITLQKGETYQLAADVFFADLTGSIITSNNPISVFSGHTCGNEPLFTDGCDHMIEQIPPVTTLGKSFVTVPLATRRAGDVFRIVATEDDTNVSVNGNNGYAEIFSLDKGEFKILNVPSNVYSKIESNHAILVAQLSKGQKSDNVPSDPFLMLVPPIEQFQNHYKVSTPAIEFDKHFINLAVPISQKDKIELDGSFLDPSIFTDIPGSTHAGAQVEVDEGMHNITGELPFVAFMYGFGSFESYGYPGGHSLASVKQVRSINLDLVEEAQQGITYCFNATVKDDNEIPIFGVRVDFEVQGPNEKIGFAVTNEQGIANFCFDAIRPGTNKIIATVGSTETATIIETEKTPVPTTITFLEYVVQGIVGEEICLVATILDQFGMPLGGEEVSFDVNGLFYSTAITDEDGRIVFCQTPDDMGDLIVTAYFEGGESTEATIIAGYVSEDLKIESFWWVDASTNTIISEIKAGDKIPYSTIKDKKLTIVVTSDPEIVGSVKMEMEYLTSCPTCAIENYTITENIIPYSLYGDVKGRYVGYGFSPGSYALTATPYETRYHTGNQGLKATINFEVLFDSSIDGFTLINATNDTDIREIMDGDIIDLSSFKGKKFNVRANVPLNQQQGGVGMEISGPVNFSQFEKFEPYALFMDTDGDYAGKELPEGKYTLSATAFPFNSSTNKGIGGETVTINFEVMILGSKVDRFTLVNADTDKDIMTIMEGTYIDLNQYKDVKLNIRADGKGDDIAAMTFQLSGAKNYNWTERKAPYAIFGDLPAEDYNGKYFKEGNYKLMVTPYNSDNTMGEPLTVNFSAGYDGGDNLETNIREEVPVWSLVLNTGSDVNTSYQGKLFLGDVAYPEFFNSNKTYRTTSASTTELFQTDRYGKYLGYSIPVDNGTYRVRTFHNELWFGRSGAIGKAGQRVFDILIEGVLVKDDFDLFVESNYQPTELIFEDIVIIDGEINLDFIASKNNANVSGLILERTDPKNDAEGTNARIMKLEDISLVGTVEVTNEELEKPILIKAKLYPNPAQNEVFIFLEKEVSMEWINIYDLNGRQVLTFDARNNPVNKYTVPLDKLVQGVYMVRLLGKDGIVDQLRLIINR